jgi:hypothetical protein
MSQESSGQWYNGKSDISFLSSCEQAGRSRVKESATGQVQNRKKKGTGMNASAETWHLDDQTVQVTHLEKVYWPQMGFTKGAVLDYYRQIAPVLLPYLKDRPVTLRMYPQGCRGNLVLPA